MIKWEYDSYTYDFLNPKEFKTHLDTMGSLGWEMINFQMIQTGSITQRIFCIFKRHLVK